MPLARHSLRGESFPACLGRFALSPSEQRSRLSARAQVRANSKRLTDEDQAFLMTSMERMRARCTVPRDVVQVYEALNKVGLQYGPAFRLLSDVYIPDMKQ